MKFDKEVVDGGSTGTTEKLRMQIYLQLATLRAESLLFPIFKITEILRTL